MIMASGCIAAQHAQYAQQPSNSVQHMLYSVHSYTPHAEPTERICHLPRWPAWVQPLAVHLVPQGLHSLGGAQLQLTHYVLQALLHGAAAHVALCHQLSAHPAGYVMLWIVASNCSVLVRAVGLQLHATSRLQCWQACGLYCSAHVSAAERQGSCRRGHHNA